MTDRTVRVILTATAAQYSQTMARAGRTAERTAARVQSSMGQAAARSSQAWQQQNRRVQAATAGTFASVGSQASSAVRAAQQAAGQSAQAVAAGAQAMSLSTARAAVQTAQAGQRATTAAASSAAASTQRIATSAAAVPAAFRAASAGSVQALGRMDLAAATSTQAMGRMALTNRASLTASAAAVTQVQTSMSRAAVAAAAASNRQIRSAQRLSVANRAAVLSAAQAAGATVASGGAFTRAGERARAMGSSVVTAASRSEKSLGMLRTVSLGLLAAFGVAVYAAARFEKSMSAVKAVSGAAGAELQQLRDAALEAGRTTQYSATQAADAEAELARAGIKTADIVGGALTGALALAAAGQLDLSEAAIVSAQTMNTFALSGKDMSHVADVLAAGANKSATDVHKMGLAIRMGGLVAHQTGLSLEETAGAIAAFADHALIGSDAGTSLKVMLQRLTPQSKEAQAMMDKLGFSAYDSQGRFVGLSELAGRLQASFKGLTPEARNAAFGVIFGSDAVRSASILYELGAKGIDEYTKKVNDQGYATRTAATQMDNLIGDFELLKSALETALIQSGTAANSVLRDMTQWVTRLVNAYSSLPPELQSTATLFAGLAGAIGLAGAGMLLMLPRIMTVRRELIAMGLTAQRVRGMMMGLGRLGLVIGGLAAISWGVEKLTKQFQEAPPNITQMTNAMVDFARKGQASGVLVDEFGENLDGLGEAVARIAHPGVLDRVGDSLYTITHIGSDSQALDEARQKIEAIDESLSSLVQSGNADVAAVNFQAYAKAAEKSGTSMEKFRTLLPKYTDTLTAADTQTKLAADSQSDLGSEVEKTKEDLEEQQTAAEQLSDALDALNGVNITAAERSISFRQSLADLTKTVKDSGHSLDETTDKGRKVKGAYLDAAKAALEHAQAVAEQSNSVEAGNAILAADIAALKKTMKQAGFTQEQIDELTAAYTRLPESESTQVTAPGATQATREVDDLFESVADLQPGKTIVIKAPTGEAIKALQAAGYNVEKIPNSKNVSVTAPTGTAVANAQALKRQLDALKNKYITVTANFRITGSGQARAAYSQAGGHVFEYAYGGIVGRAADGLYIPGYAPRRDTELILASKGEGVLVPEAVRALGQMSGLGARGIIDALNSWGRSGAMMPARMFPARATASSMGGPSPAQVTSYTINARTADFTVRDLERVQRVQEARARVGRPR
ncbi:phage tail tape measure protein [Streptomyces sp. bgisy154]|uniref:phage tail tape measure protein n=1 Tax=Streptomyces sp. bgisy154 TaxID=3413794 RepID=UPI003D706ADF